MNAAHEMVTGAKYTPGNGCPLPACPVFYTQKSLSHRLSQGGKEQTIAEYEQGAIPMAQRQMAWRRIASATQVTTEPPDQCDRFAEVFRWFESFFFA